MKYIYLTLFLITLDPFLYSYIILRYTYIRRYIIVNVSNIFTAVKIKELKNDKYRLDFYCGCLDQAFLTYAHGIAPAKDVLAQLSNSEQPVNIDALLEMTNTTELVSVARFTRKFNCEFTQEGINKALSKLGYVVVYYSVPSPMDESSDDEDRAIS